jgi:hypothetical protein
MVRTYQEAFEDLYLLDVPGTTNKILLALPRKQSLDRGGLAQLAKRTGSTKRFPFELGDIEEGQFHPLSRKGKTGRVLRDAETVEPAAAAAR